VCFSCEPAVLKPNVYHCFSVPGRNSMGLQVQLLEGEFFSFFFFYGRYLTLLYLPPLRFHCVGRCWDRAQDCCEWLQSKTMKVLFFMFICLQRLSKRLRRDPLFQGEYCSVCTRTCYQTSIKCAVQCATVQSSLKLGKIFEQNGPCKIRCSFPLFLTNFPKLQASSNVDLKYESA
jgi:hypothetical protein